MSDNDRKHRNAHRNVSDKRQFPGIKDGPAVQCLSISEKCELGRLPMPKRPMVMRLVKGVHRKVIDQLI